MSFNYQKHKDGSGDSFWTSYSDLFLGMSVVFLLLYVTASLRTGTNGVQQQIQNEKLSMQVKDLQNQLKMYNSVKSDYLANEAKPDEEKLYNELMDKLSLLKEEAKDEKDRLSQAALENEKKEKALNQYQQMVRNIVNANVLAKTKIKKRNEVIDEQDEEIETQDQEISQLEQDVAKKKKQIEENEQKIAATEEQLDERLDQLKKAFKAKKMSEAAYEKKVEALQAESENKIAQLRGKNDEFQEQLDSANQQIAQVKGELGKVSGQLTQTQGALVQKEVENQELQGKLGSLRGEYDQQVEDLKNDFAEKAAQERKAFENQLNKERLSSADRAKKEAAFKADADRKQRQLADQIRGLGDELREKEGKIQEKEGQLAAKEGQLRDREAKLKDTEGELAKARAEADARRKISKDIREGFSKAGVDADVNDKTGEVIINFGDVYFDNDSAKLKQQMRETLKKAMPVYSKSLLGNEKVANKIASVEIIGFASPTFKGKYVDPTNLDTGARKAIDYNLDLSYNRARSIFQYIFDENQIQFDHQKDMLPLIKVTGRSFLAEKLPNKRNPTGGSNDFCSTHDCKKAQRVIIRFSFEDKK